MQDQAAAEISPQTAVNSPSGREALRFWAWLGCVSFGGPAGQISIMHEEVVERKRWVDEQRFSHALSYCMVLPGPEAQQLATYLGWLLHGVWGGVAAGLLFILPGFLLLMTLSAISALGGEVAWVRAIFRGFEPAVVAVIYVATWRMAKRGLRSNVGWLLAFGAFVALVCQVPFAVILVVAALVGWFAKLQPAAHGKSANAIRAVAEPPSDDATVHTTSWSRMLRLVFVFALLWGLAFGAICLWRGLESVPSRMALFFSEAALLTFGGAYAVLPYVSEQAVQANWITPDQVISGLAFGETTPGPLVLVLTYFGFMGGYRNANASPLSEGIFCGTLTTYFTFLPSFAFILLGAPWIERLHNWHWLTGAMAGIAAAVVGVILHLGVTVWLRVWWPLAANPHDLSEIFRGAWRWEALARVDLFAVVLSLLAGVALLHFRQSVPRVVLVAGLLGLLRWFITG
jgi:chromate transporter